MRFTVLFLLDPIDCSKDLIFGYVSIASLSSAPITSIHVVISCLICVTLLYPQESKNAVIQRTAPSGSHQLAMDKHPNPKHPSPVPHHSVPQTAFVEIKCSFCILFRRSGRELWAELGVIRNAPITGIFRLKGLHSLVDPVPVLSFRIEIDCTCSTPFSAWGSMANPPC